MSKSKESPNYNCLLRISNTDKNRDKIKGLNKQMKEYGSRWRLSYKARKPVEGKKYGFGGSLKIEDGQEIGIYIKHAKDFTDQVETAYQRSRDRELADLKNELRLATYYRENAEKQVKILWKHSVKPPSEWDGDDCPICGDTDLECTEDYVDSEEWECPNCGGRWTCNKESIRSDLDIA